MVEPDAALGEHRPGLPRLLDAVLGERRVAPPLDLAALVEERLAVAHEIQVLHERPFGLVPGPFFLKIHAVTMHATAVSDSGNTQVLNAPAPSSGSATFMP